MSLRKPDVWPESKWVIGNGGYGSVALFHLVFTKHGNAYQPVAVKRSNRLNEEGEYGKEAAMQNKYIREQFEHEEQMYKHLKGNPFAVELLCERIESKNHDFLVMEYIEGGDLYDYLQALAAHAPGSVPLPEAAIRLIALQHLRFLELARERGGVRLLHNDFKDENVFVDGKTGLIKIGDYGLSLLVGEGQTHAIVTQEELNSLKVVLPPELLRHHSELAEKIAEKYPAGDMPLEETKDSSGKYVSVTLTNAFGCITECRV